MRGQLWSLVLPGLCYNRYQELSNSDDPFVCLSCTNLSLSQEIAALKVELKNVQKVCDEYSALAAEVAALQEALDTLKTSKSRYLQQREQSEKPLKRMIEQG